MQGRKLSPEELERKLKTVGTLVVLGTFGLGFTLGNVFAILSH